MSELTERARELLDGITPGPWTPSIARDGECVGVDNSNDEQLFIETYGVTYAVNPADAIFIAASPQLVADLTGALERVEKLAERLICDVETTIAQWICDALEDK